MSICYIVMYHYVRDLKKSRYPEIKGLDKDIFKDQIKFLLKKGFVFINEEQLENACYRNTPLPEKSVLLTFDDAYIDHYTNVFPVLDQYGIQGCFYVPVKAVKNHQVLNVNKIHFILASCRDKMYLIKEIYDLLDKYRDEYDIESNEYYFNKLAIANRWDPKEVIFIKRLLQVELVESLRNTIVDILFQRYVSEDEQVFSQELYMNEDQIKCMQRNGMHIGAHGYDHYWLNCLNKIEQESEIKKSVEFLEKIGVNCKDKGWTIGYPYGAYDEKLIDVLKKYNCRLGFTTRADLSSVDYNNRFILARYDANDVYKFM